MIENESGSVIDSNFVDGSRINLLTVAPISNCLSDHEVQFLVLEKVAISSEISLTYRSCYTNKDSTEHFIVIIKNETWENTCSMNQVRDIFSAFLNAFLFHSNSYLPVYYVTRKHKTDWITIGIRTFCKMK